MTLELTRQSMDVSINGAAAKLTTGVDGDFAHEVRHFRL